MQELRDAVDYLEVAEFHVKNSCHLVQDNTLLREPACNAWLLKYAGSWKRKQKNKTVENAKPAILNTLTPRIGDLVRIR